MPLKPDIMGLSSYENIRNLDNPLVVNTGGIMLDRPRLHIRLGKSVPPRIGISEFVINSGSNGMPVFIKSVTWTGAYFAE